MLPLFILAIAQVVTQSAISPLSQTSSAPSSNDTEILVALIAVGGVLLGAILSFLAQIITSTIDKNRERKKFLFEKQAEIYPQALQYIIILSQLQAAINRKDTSETKRLMEEEQQSYRDFYYIFALVSSHKILAEFNALKDEVSKNKIASTEAYKRLQEILKFS